MFLFLGIALAQDRHQVLTYFTNINQDCIQNKCSDDLSACGDDFNDCHERMSCMKELKNAEKCFKTVKWSQLDSIEMQVFDCAHRQGCLSGGEDGASFLERLGEERQRRGAAPLSGPPSSFAEATAQATAQAKAQAQAQAKAQAQARMDARIESEARSMSANEKVAMDVLDANLLMMMKSEELAKHTGKLVEAVKSSETMTNHEKAHALDLLSDHLHVLKEGADDAMRGLGFHVNEMKPTLDEEKDAPDTAAKNKKDFQKVVAKLSSENSLAELTKSAVEEAKRMSRHRALLPLTHPAAVRALNAHAKKMQEAFAQARSNASAGTRASADDIRRKRS